MDIKRELRRSRNELSIAGSGMIAFGFWTMIKTILILFTKKEEITGVVNESLAIIQNDAPEVGRFLVALIVYIIIAFFIILIFIVYFSIGRACISVGKKEKKKILYIPVSLILGVSFLYSVVYDINNASTAFDSVFDCIANVIFDLSTAITMLAIVYSSVRIFVLTRKLKAKEAA